MQHSSSKPAFSFLTLTRLSSQAFVSQEYEIKRSSLVLQNSHFSPDIKNRSDKVLFLPSNIVGIYKLQIWGWPF